MQQAPLLQGLPAADAPGLQAAAVGQGGEHGNQLGVGRLCHVNICQFQAGGMGGTQEGGECVEASTIAALRGVCMCGSVCVRMYVCMRDPDHPRLTQIILC